MLGSGGYKPRTRDRRQHFSIAGFPFCFFSRQNVSHKSCFDLGCPSHQFTEIWNRLYSNMPLRSTAETRKCVRLKRPSGPRSSRRRWPSASPVPSAHAVHVLDVTVAFRISPQIGQRKRWSPCWNNPNLAVCDCRELRHRLLRYGEIVSAERIRRV